MMPNKNILPTIPADKSKDFIRKANENVLTGEYLENCAKSAQKFHEEQKK